MRTTVRIHFARQSDYIGETKKQSSLGQSQEAPGGGSWESDILLGGIKVSKQVSEAVC